MPADAYDDAVLIQFLPGPRKGDGPWSRIVRDYLAPAPECDYAAAVTKDRIYDYDEIRTFVMRGALLVGVVVCFVVMGVTAWWAYSLLIPGFLQTAAEIRSDFYQKGAKRHLEKMSLLYVPNQFERTLSSFTGWVGFVAVGCLLAAVLAAPAGNPSWVKLVALLLVTAYATSGISAVLLDATHYSRHKVRFIRRWVDPFRGQVWLIVAAVAAGLVTWSVSAGRWDAEIVPAAYLVVVAGSVVMGMRVRDYDRLIRAGAGVTAKAMTDARSRFLHSAHDTALSSSRYLLQRVAELPTTPTWIRTNAHQLVAEIKGLGDVVDEARWIQIRPQRVGTAADALAEGLRLNVTVLYDLPAMNADNAKLTEDFIGTALLNTAQAYDRCETDAQDRKVTVAAHSGEGTLTVEVSDDLGLVPAEVFCAAGSTLGNLRNRFVSAGGDITQSPHGAGKIVMARWPAMRPRHLPPRRERRSAR